MKNKDITDMSISELCGLSLQEQKEACITLCEVSCVHYRPLIRALLQNIKQHDETNDTLFYAKIITMVMNEIRGYIK